jgi:soluble lytic murein transglycosylase
MVRNESRFDPTARSRVGAVGLMQLMPDTAQEIANKLGYAEYDLTDADTNIRFGCYYLAYLYRNTGRNWRNAVAAYNCGIGKVNAWLSDPAYSKDGELTAIPVDETRLYVEYVFRDAEKYKELLKEKSED